MSEVLIREYACDGCEESTIAFDGPDARNPVKAWQRALASGWVRFAGTHFCPNCNGKAEKEKAS